MPGVRTSYAKRWLPIALCCVPGLGAATFLGVGLLTDGVVMGPSLQGPAAIVVLAVALLACPLGMGVMLSWSRRRQAQSMPASESEVCCDPGMLVKSFGQWKASDQRQVSTTEGIET